MTINRGFKILEGFEELAKLPQRATLKSAGYDLHAAIEQPWRLLPGNGLLISTGLTVYMKEDEELQIRSRSGLAFKKAIVVLNSPGTIDADYYPNQIKVLLFNHGLEPFVIKPGDRIAQAIFSKYLITDDDEPADKVREAGFGSTGV